MIHRGWPSEFCSGDRVGSVSGKIVASVMTNDDVIRSSAIVKSPATLECEDPESGWLFDLIYCGLGRPVLKSEFWLNWSLLSCNNLWDGPVFRKLKLLLKLVAGSLCSKFLTPSSIVDGIADKTIGVFISDCLPIPWFMSSDGTTSEGSADARAQWVVTNKKWTRKNENKAGQQWEIPFFRYLAITNVALNYTDAITAPSASDWCPDGNYYCQIFNCKQS